MNKELLADSSQWLVRDEKGGEYGPVNLQTLQAWARDGRLGPANTVSQDGEKWQPAMDLPELELKWLVEIAPGRFYGPVHCDAIRGLTEDGSIAEEASLFCRMVASDDAKWREQLEKLRQDAAAVRDEVQVLRAELQAAQQMLACEQTLGKALNSSIKEAHKEIEELRTQLITSGNQLGMVHDQLFQERRLSDNLRLELDSATSEVDQLRNQNMVACQAATEWREKFDALTIDSDAMRQKLLMSLSELDGRAKMLREQLDSAEDVAHAAVRKCQAQQVDLLAQQVANDELQQELRGLRQRDAALREQLKEFEQESSMEAEASVVEILEPEVFEPDVSPLDKPPRQGVDSSFQADFAKVKGGAPLALEELERQARLELERLGAHAPEFFKKRR